MESYFVWILILAIIAGTLWRMKKSNEKSVDINTSHSEDEAFINDDDEEKINLEEIENISENARFKKFQKSYVLVFLTVMLADWMQGPYVYKLYDQYNYNPQEIAFLFIIGFGTSGIFGAFIGSFADRFGRKLTCILFCILYGICCFTKHFHNYYMLILGRVLGGISTSILFSCFEAWMVSHHQKEKFPMSKLGSTFELAWSLNSFVAVAAGFITSFFVRLYTNYDIAQPAEVAAFDCSSVVLMVACLIIYYSWIENTGDTNVNIMQSISNTMKVFKNDINITYVGCIQSGFESAMYLFVFMWTMALENVRTNTDVEIDHGIIFAVFMEACLVGTLICGLLKNVSAEKIGIIVCLIAACAMIVVPFTNNYEIRLLMFIVFECCVGIYFPTIGGLRSKYVPENVRATVMNIFRIPLNLIVVCTLSYLHEIAMNVFLLCAVLLMVGAFASFLLQKKSLAGKKYN